jgi:hypothetical protein
MPKAMEAALKKQALKMARSGDLHRKSGESRKEAMAAFVYGTLRKTGWKPSRERRSAMKRRKSALRGG